MFASPPRCRRWHGSFGNAAAIRYVRRVSRPDRELLMIRSAVTISLVSEARGGPFVYWDDLAAGVKSAARLGYDAVEVFAPGPKAVEERVLRSLLGDHNLKLAAVGTGGGWVIHKLALTDADAGVRAKAREFIRSMIDFGGPHGAPAIIGSMQGRWLGAVDKATALGYLGEAVAELGEHAKQYGVPLIYEPLNRYETNLCCTQADGVKLLESLGRPNAKLLADLFHMNIEEQTIAGGLRDGGRWVGHVHFVDSNRRPAGNGHMDYGPIAAALREIGYDGYASAEAFSWPDAESAAEQTMRTFRAAFR
jgi:sugar phosphate isomerase/epimerase